MVSLDTVTRGTLRQGTFRLVSGSTDGNGMLSCPFSKSLYKDDDLKIPESLCLPTPPTSMMRNLPSASATAWRDIEKNFL